jgi:hypothetical protein
LQRTLINLIALEKIDRSSRVAVEARKGKLHLIFVAVGDRDYSVARPHWASHPLPLLDYLPVGLKDALAESPSAY